MIKKLLQAFQQQFFSEEKVKRKTMLQNLDVCSSYSMIP